MELSELLITMFKFSLDVEKWWNYDVLKIFALSAGHHFQGHVLTLAKDLDGL
jgi:hypothetical protein